MKQGAARHALKDRGADFYETPAEATLALLKYESLMGRIWEPCAGRGAIARLLIQAGHDVVCHDLNAWSGADEGIETPIDFLLEQQAPQGCRTIVTNPPYNILNPFLRHSLQLVDTVIVLLPLMRQEGSTRSDLIDYHLKRVWAFRERLPMMHREGWEGKKTGIGGVPFGWFVFGTQPHAPDTGFTTRRVSWRV